VIFWGSRARLRSGWQSCSSCAVGVAIESKVDSFSAWRSTSKALETSSME
jgi:hypothetical protein